jgi:hypothetical protein
MLFVLAGNNPPMPLAVIAPRLKSKKSRRIVEDLGARLKL